jgi:hypothetical protein
VNSEAMEADPTTSSSTSRLPRAPVTRSLTSRTHSNSIRVLLAGVKISPASIENGHTCLAQEVISRCGAGFPLPKGMQLTSAADTSVTMS